MPELEKTIEPSEWEKQALVKGRREKATHLPGESRQALQRPGTDVRGFVPRPVTNTIMSPSETIPPDPRHKNAIPLSIPEVADPLQPKPYQPDMSLSLPAHGPEATTAPAAALPSGMSVDVTGGTNFKPYDPNDTKRPLAGSVVGKNSALPPIAGTGFKKMGDGTLELYNQRGERTLADMAGTGPQGGSVSQVTMSPEQQKEVDGRRAEAIPAMENYTKALDQRNAEAGIHGADMARQINMFRDKYGIDLRGKEFQLKQAELLQNAPKVAAEAEQARAHAEYYKNRGTGQDSKTNNVLIQGYNKHIDEAMKKLGDPAISEDDRTTAEQAIQYYQTRIDDISKTLSSEKDKAPKLTPDQDKQIRARIKEAESKGTPRPTIDAELTKLGLKPEDYK
jgi:hypothetical protein